MGDAETFIKLLGGGGVAFLLFLVIKGVFRLGRESEAEAKHHAERIADKERENDRLVKELAERTADRDKWIAVVLQWSPIIEKQSQAIAAQGETIKDLKDVMEDMAQALKGKQG